MSESMGVTFDPLSLSHILEAKVEDLSPEQFERLIEGLRAERVAYEAAIAAGKKKAAKSPVQAAVKESKAATKAAEAAQLSLEDLGL